MSPEIDEHTVYIIAHCDNSGQLRGPVKVGFTRNAEKRLASLQTGNPHALQLVVRFLTPSRDLARECESAFHAVAADRRLAGEWFDLEPVVASAALIKCLVALIGTQVTDTDDALELLRWSGVVEATAALPLLSKKGAAE